MPAEPSALISFAMLASSRCESYVTSAAPSAARSSERRERGRHVRERVLELHGELLLAELAHQLVLFLDEHEPPPRMMPIRSAISSASSM